MEDQNKESENKNTAETLPEAIKNQPVSAEENRSGSKIPMIIIGVVLVLAGLIYLFIKLNTETIGKIRDISVILWVLESVVTVTALVVLVVQTAKLVNFLKYEIAPILNTTQKTVQKVSGTVSFLCENAVEPTKEAVSKVSGIMSAVSGILSIFKKN